MRAKGRKYILGGGGSEDGRTGVVVANDQTVGPGDSYLRLTPMLPHDAHVRWWCTFFLRYLDQSFR